MSMLRPPAAKTDTPRVTRAPRRNWRERVSQMSRSRRFLWKFGLGALLLGTILGVCLSYLTASPRGLFAERVLAHAGLTTEDGLPEDFDRVAAEVVEGFQREVRDPALRFIELLWAVPDLVAYLSSAPTHRLAAALAERFEPEQVDLVLLYLASWNGGETEAREQLRALAQSAQPPRFAAFVAGQVEYRIGNFRAAHDLFRQEHEREPAASESRYMVVRSLLADDDFATLGDLRADPLFAPYFTAFVELEMAIGQRDWSGIVHHLLQTQWTSYRSRVVPVAIITALAWALLLQTLGQRTYAAPRQSVLALAAFAAGVASTTLTLIFVIIQDDILGLSEGYTAQASLVYYIAGVGLREELAKLLLFAPLLPFLIRRGTELDALIIASFVGLGFAIEENVGYFLKSEAASAPGRFLTANFLHIALTGVNGLALYRACTQGVSGWNEFLIVFPLTVVAHGVYDALIDLPGYPEASPLSTIIFVFICLHYFRCAHPLRARTRTTLSLTGAFVFGLSIVAASAIAFQMATLGAAAGGRLIFGELIGSAILLFVFFREFDEALQP